MADVFISYSKNDADKVRLLSAYLEANGYTVWWDTNLETADDFSDAILKQIELARAVLVLWTENSVKSTFVYAEAQTAHHHEKLVPVRADSVGYEQIRPPFNALHTQEFDDFPAILAAVEKRIAAPKSSRYLLKNARYQALLWFGVFGSAITFFTGLESVLKLANWASWLSLFWADLCGSAFVQAFKVFAIDFPKELVVPATTMLFVFSTIIGSRLVASRYRASNKHPGAATISHLTILEFVVLAGAGIVGFTLAKDVYGLQILRMVGISELHFDLYVYFLIFAFSIVLSAIWNRAWKPTDLLILTTSYFLLVVLIAVVWTKLSMKFGNFRIEGGAQNVLWFTLVFSYALIPFIAPVRGLFKRVGMIYLFIFALISLNGLAHLGLDVSTPPVRSAYAGDRDVPESDPGARSWYARAASWGDPVAMRLLGQLYAKGQDVPQDYRKAREWFEKAAAKGNSPAMRRLGDLYANGQGVAKDEAKAREWYGQADANVDLDIFDWIALQVAVTAPEYGERLGLHVATPIKYWLGVAYANGEMVARDYSKARTWYEQAAVEGNSMAMNNLGVLYEFGQGVAPDYVRARELYERAAAKGNNVAMRNIASLYERGKGVAQNYAKAREWYGKAAIEGNKYAMRDLGDLYSDGRGGPRDYVQAREWYEKSAAKGNGDGMYALGWLYQYAHGVAQDYVKAREWYERAAASGHRGATYTVGDFYADGLGVTKDYTKALKWYEKAAAGGNASAMERIGKLYQNGHGVTQDYAKAREWYERAAKSALASGKYAKALSLQAAAAVNAERFEKEQRGKPGVETAISLGDMAWYAAMAGEPARALAAASRAHELNPSDLWVEATRAHALLFLDRFDEARALYLANKGKSMPNVDDQLWEQVVGEDFAKFRKAGLDHPRMTEIEATLGIKR